VIPVQNAASPVLLHRLHHPVAFEPFLDVSNDVGGAPDAIGHSSFLPVPSRPTPPHKHYLNSHNTLSPTDNQPYNKPLRYQYTVITRSACQRVNAHTSHETPTVETQNGVQAPDQRRAQDERRGHQESSTIQSSRQESDSQTRTKGATRTEQGRLGCGWRQLRPRCGRRIRHHGLKNRQQSRRDGREHNIRRTVSKTHCKHFAHVS
jgi:hypothetical protein